MGSVNTLEEQGTPHKILLSFACNYVKFRPSRWPSRYKYIYVQLITYCIETVNVLLSEIMRYLPKINLFTSILIIFSFIIEILVQSYIKFYQFVSLLLSSIISLISSNKLVSVSVSHSWLATSYQS